MSKIKAGATGNLSSFEKKKLERLYKRGPNAFGSIQNLSKASGYSLDKVREFLHSKDSYTKYFPVKRNFQRLGAFASHINHTWSLDLAFVDKLAEWNKNVKYLLVCIDNFSRFLRVEPLKNKEASTTKTAFQKMLKKGQQPKYIWIDDGSEFEASFKSFCKSVGIKIYHTFSENKACYAERAIRTLKNLLYRYMEEENTSTYIDKLQELVDTINGRKHRTIGEIPKKVTNAHAMNVLYGNMRISKAKPKLKIGDEVRISKQKVPFHKGYKPGFSREIFVIYKINKTHPPTYLIKDLHDEDIKGKFYEKELVLQTK